MAGDLVGIPGGPQDLLGVVLQDLDPALDVGGVLARVVADAELVADPQGGDLGAQLFLGVADAAEGMGQVPIQAARMPCPAAKLVERDNER
jgi:hypothetical protein